jgi:diguanylate cyclase
MFLNDISSLIFTIVWSLAAVGVGLASGFFIGRAFALSNEPRRLKKEREKTLESLLKLMNSTDQLNIDVDQHNTALRSAKEELETIETVEAFEGLQDSLVENIRTVVTSNRKLENDLVVSKFKLESQAQELDRSRKEARTDSLCKVGNRKAVDETLQFMVSRYQNEKKSFGLMLIDIDHFKRINDTFGHDAGDEVLVNIGQALKECVRPEDFVGRLGGDEFVIMLEGLTDENAKFVGSRVRSTIELYNFSVGNKGQSTVVTMSMGLAVVKPEDDVKKLYRRADRALYRSKELGRNRLCTLIGDEQEDGGTEAVADKKIDCYQTLKANIIDDDQPNPLGR